MRTHVTSVLPLALLFAAIGCGRENPTAPAASTLSTAASYSPQFVIHSLDDPALPSPGREAEGATSEDRALFERFSNRAPSSGDERDDRSGAEAGGDAVVFWNRITRELGIDAKLPPPLLARAYALVHVGIYDALVASDDDRRGRLPGRAVAAGVASRVLEYLFPAKLERIGSAVGEELALVPGSDRRALRGWTMGRAVGRAAVARGKRDGSDTPFTGTMPTGDGIWTGTNPVLPMCGTWKTWVIRSGSAIQPEPPYAYGSVKDLAETQEVLDVSLHRTPEQIAIVHKWADTSPPAIWNDLLNDRIEARGMNLIRAARAHAFLNAAMADAFIECWACKYRFWIARPFQRTPGLVTVITTPNFPSYTSGHSTISAAAAVVLGEVFPGEREYFDQQSEEAAMSRLYGGIHFRHDNEEGTRVGKIIGRKVVRRMRGEDEREFLARN